MAVLIVLSKYYVKRPMLRVEFPSQLYLGSRFGSPNAYHMVVTLILILGPGVTKVIFPVSRLLSALGLVWRHAADSVSSLSACRVSKWRRRFCAGSCAG